MSESNTSTDARVESWMDGDWVQTYSGRRFHLLNPRAVDVEPVDFTQALGQLARYNGQGHKFYTVAEHCWHLSYAVPAEHALVALLHDATEAYVGDVVRPLKKHLPRFAEIEHNIWLAIAARMNLPSAVIPDEVHAADRRILADERAALFGTQHAWPEDNLEPLGVEIYGWGPEEASLNYWLRLQQLGAI